MISNSMSTAASGLMAQRRMIDTISQNIANADNPNYKRQDATVETVGSNSTGVRVSVATQNQPWLDRQLSVTSTEMYRSQAAREVTESVDFAVSHSRIDQTYSDFVNAARDLQQFPQDQVRLQNFNSAGAAFNSAINQTQDSIQGIRDDIQVKVELSQIELDGLKEQLSKIAVNGITSDNSGEVQKIQQRIANLTGTISGYTEVMNSIMPPLMAKFTVVTDAVKTNINTAGGTEMFSNGEWVDQTRVQAGTIGNTPGVIDFGNQYSAFKTLLGSVASRGRLDEEYATQDYHEAANRYADAYGVDISQETIKLLQSQRLYEANAKVLAASDSMIGTLLNVMG